MLSIYVWIYVSYPSVFAMYIFETIKIEPPRANTEMDNTTKKGIICFIDAAII